MAENSKPVKDAIIFIPGLGQDIQDIPAQKIDVIARKLAESLNVQLDRPDLQTRVVGGRDEEYGGTAYTTPVRTIATLEPGSEELNELADIYEFDYRENLYKRFKARNPIYKALTMEGILLGVMPKFFRSMFRSGQNARDKIQMFLVGGIMLTMAVYMVILVGTALVTVTPEEYIATSWNQIKHFVTGSGNDVQMQDRLAHNALVSTDNDTAEQNKSSTADNGGLLKRFQYLIVIFAALGLFQKKSIKEVMRTISTEYACASNYFRLGSQKTAILGQGTALLEHIAEKKDKYRHVHIIAYSFGSLVAIDMLFPHTSPVTRIKTVHSLITIGCPLNLIRTYWPAYYKQRKQLKGIPEHWSNIYTPQDVFGTCFKSREEERKGEEESTQAKKKDICQEPGIEIIEPVRKIVRPTSEIEYNIGAQAAGYNIFDILALKGIKIHSSYWTANEAPELSCFDVIIRELYGGTGAEPN